LLKDLDNDRTDISHRCGYSFYLSFTLFVKEFLMPLFMKKPIVVEARQWDGTFKSARELIEWSKNNLCWVEQGLFVETLEGILVVRERDWIIKDDKGSYHPCAEEIFYENYDEI
jgi:hypothetical protein